MSLLSNNIVPKTTISVFFLHLIFTFTPSFFFFFNDPATTEIYTFPYTTLFRSRLAHPRGHRPGLDVPPGAAVRSEEHTSELQSRQYLVCRLLLEKKKKK